MKHRFVEGWPHAYLIVQDLMAGRRHVYTVHQISLTSDKGSRVIGRELDLRTAKKVIADDQKKGRVDA